MCYDAYSIPDHPVIQNLERTGCPDGKEPKFPLCPVCGSETDTYIQDKDGQIVGCDCCICRVDAWNY